MVTREEFNKAFGFLSESTLQEGFDLYPVNEEAEVERWNVWYWGYIIDILAREGFADEYPEAYRMIQYNNGYLVSQEVANKIADLLERWLQNPYELGMRGAGVKANLSAFELVKQAGFTDVILGTPDNIVEELEQDLPGFIQWLRSSGGFEVR